MEALIPLLGLVQGVRLRLECGQSMRTALTDIMGEEGGELHEEILSLLTRGTATTVSGPLWNACFDSLSRGLRGESVQSVLAVLEKDIVECCRDQMEEFVGGLPLKLLLPLLLLQFPAFLVLLFGPLLSNLIDSLNH